MIIRETTDSIDNTDLTNEDEGQRLESSRKRCLPL